MKPTKQTSSSKAKNKSAKSSNQTKIEQNDHQIKVASKPGVIGYLIFPLQVYAFLLIFNQGHSSLLLFIPYLIQYLLL